MTLRRESRRPQLHGGEKVTPTSSLNYPKQRLLFFLAGSVSPPMRERVPDLVDRLAQGHEWVINPPVFLDEVDPATRPGVDSSIEIVGARLEIYSALSPTQLPKEIDLRLLDDVECFVEMVRKLSSETGSCFEFELDGDGIGSITAGELDSGLRDCFILEWKKHLGVSN